MKKADTIYSAAIIGAGRIGHTLSADRLREQPASHSAAFAFNRRIRLVAVADPVAAARERFHADFPAARVYPDAAELMKSEKPDIVVIAVPEAAHKDLSLAVLRCRPRLVILEKPVAPDLEAAREIKAAAQEYGVPVQVNHERRFAADFHRVKTLLAADAIGRLQAVRAHVWSGIPAWQESARQNGGCSLLRDGTHLVDTIHYLLDAQLKNPELDFKRDGGPGEIISLNVHYRLPGNLFVALDVSGDKKNFDFEIELQGERGRIFVGNGFLRLLRASASRFYAGFRSLRRDPSVKRPKATGYFRNMVDNCVAFLDDRDELGSPLDAGIKALEALYGIVDTLG